MRNHQRLRQGLLLLGIWAMALMAGGLQAQGGLDEVEIHRWKLGAHRDSVLAVKPRGKLQRLQRHVPIEEEISWNGFPIERVKLYMHDGHLHSIEFRVASQARAEQMAEKLEELYGKGDEIDAFGTNKVWVGSTVHLLYEFDNLDQSAKLVFTHIPTHNLYVEYLRKLDRGE